MDNVKDSITITLKSNLGTLVQLNTSIDGKIVYDKKQPFEKSTVSLSSNDVDLLILSTPVGFIGVDDTIQIRPSEKYNITINDDKVSIVNAENNTEAKRWNKSDIFPNYEKYALIEKMKSTILNNSFFLPPPMFDGTNPSSFVKRKLQTPQKKNPSELQQLKKETSKYFAYIKDYYEEVLSTYPKAERTSEQILNESFTLKQYYQDLDRLNYMSRDLQIQQYMDSLVQRNMNINGVFAKELAVSHFKKYYLRPRNIDFAGLFEKTIPTDYKTVEQQLKLATIWEMIYRKIPRKDILKYVDMYVTQFPNDKNIDKLKTELEYSADISSDLNLESLDGKKTTFEALRKSFKGKVIYVDFWASWCAPCIDMISKNKNLHEKYKNEKVVFVYLALNDEKDKWLESVKKYDLNTNSYFITNPKSSTFIDKHNIVAIPRFMIYDKNGQLFQSNAPATNSAEIEKILNQLLYEYK